MTTKIIVDDTHVHPETGHITYTLTAETTHPSGAVTRIKKLYGVDKQGLKDRFNDDISQFENWAAREHRKFGGADMEFVDKILKRKGEVIG